MIYLNDFVFNELTVGISKQSTISAVSRTYVSGSTTTTGANCSN